MKILLVSNMYPSKEYPHYGVFVKNTYELLAELGHDVSRVVIYKKGTKIKKLISYSLFYVKIIIKVLFGKYDCVYGHYASHIAVPLLIAKKISKNSKYYINVHGNDLVPEEEKDEKFIKYVKKLLQVSDKIIAPSMYFKEILKTDYQISENKIEVFPSGGVDREIFYPMDKKEARRKFNMHEDVRYVGFVSRIEKRKGWDLFLQMVGKCEWENVHFILVGDGGQNGQLEQMIETQQLQNKVTKYSFMTHDELSIFYNALDILCFPTYRRSESLGLVGLEAMSCGCVVVASDFAGPRTYIEDGKNGFLFKVRDVDSMGDIVKTALGMMQEERDMISQCAINKAKEYDSKTMKERIAMIFS